MPNFVGGVLPVESASTVIFVQTAICLMRPVCFWPSVAHCLSEQSVLNGHLSYTATNFGSPGWLHKTDLTVVLLSFDLNCCCVCVQLPGREEQMDRGHQPCCRGVDTATGHWEGAVPQSQIHIKLVVYSTRTRGLMWCGVKRHDMVMCCDVTQCDVVMWCVIGFRLNGRTGWSGKRRKRAIGERETGATPLQHHHACVLAPQHQCVVVRPPASAQGRPHVGLSVHVMSLFACRGCLE
jgi:hypothetical protein